MASKYLDFTGLSRFLDQIKSLFAPKKQGVEYINGTQSASTNAWTGETADNELYEGKMIAYRLPFAGTSSGATLNLTFANGTTSGAKNVYLSTSTRMTAHVSAGNTVILVYHEANVIGSTTYQGWWMDAYYNSNDSAVYVYYSGSRCGTTVTNCPPTCLFLTQEETALLPTWAGKTSATAATHVMTTEEFDPFGRIYYKSSTAYNAGTLVGVATYLTNNVDLRYAFNTSGFDLLDSGVGTTVYMVCKPTTNGKAVLHDDPITKTLPIEDDGLLYVYLGRSYSSTTIYLMLDHPVYMFDAEAGEAIAIDRSYLLDRDKNRVVTESDPYIYRQTGDGKAIGDIEVLDKIVGGTVCWNQLATIADSDRSNTTNSVVVTDNRDGSFSVSTESGGATAETKIYILGNHKVLNGHVYIKSGAYLPNGIKIFDTYLGWHLSAAHRNVYKRTGTDSYTSWSVWVDSGTSIESPVTIYPGLIDLTQMFGSTIADYIYGLEQATAGAGVAWFKRYFPNEYYAYNPGELISVTGLQEHKTVRKNLFDESVLTGCSWVTKTADGWQANGASWHLHTSKSDSPERHTWAGISYMPEKRYYFRLRMITGTGPGYFSVRYDDGTYTQKVTPANSDAIVEITSSQGKNVKSFGISYGTAGLITISNVYVAFANSEEEAYESYISHSTVLDPNVKLRGIFSLDSANKLTSDGDIWTPDGKIERYYAEVDLGTLEWVYFDIEGNRRFAANMSSLKVNGIARCSKYTSTSYGDVFTNVRDKICAVHNQYAQFVVYDSEYSSAEAFKTAITGVKLVYELAEPVIEDAPTYSSMQKADPAGTEEFVSTAEIKIPVGHSTRYMLAPKLYDETQQQLMAVQKAIEGEFVSAKSEQTFTPNQQLQARENIGATGIEWIQSTQTATTNAWTGVSRDTALYDGKIICYRLSYTGSGNASLNLTLSNGDETGPIPVYWHSTTRVTTHQAAGTEWLYVYHEDYISPVDNSHKGPGWWSMNRAYYSDADSQAYILIDYYAPRVKQNMYRYVICFSDIDTELVPVHSLNNNQTTTKTLTTESFDPFGTIYVYYSTAAVTAGSTAAAKTLRRAYETLNLKYSFNTGTTLITGEPVYLVCVPQLDGRVKLAQNPIVQSIPLDGDEDLIYIHLGRAASDYQLCLYPVHNIYKVYNGAVYNIKALMLN